MGGGLAFLSKKQFNPSNISNQRRVWEAEQRRDRTEREARERSEQLAREREEEELARIRGGTVEGERAALGFMYAVPPGLERERRGGGRNGAEDEDAFDYDGDGGSGIGNGKKLPAAVASPSTSASANSNCNGNPLDLTQRQPGDDPAAAEFRKMLAGYRASGTDDPTMDQSAIHGGADNININPNALVGSTFDPSAASTDPNAKPSASDAAGDDQRTQLEKAVHRNKSYHQSLTLEDQVKRFPALKNAPMVRGMKESDVQVTFKPLGAEIRNIRCLKCGKWGHRKGDRECEIGGWDPFSMGSSSAPASSSALASASATASASGSALERKKTDRSGAAAVPAVASATDNAERATFNGSEDKRGHHRHHHHRRRKRDYSSDSSSNRSSESDYSDDSSGYDRQRRKRSSKKKRDRKKRTSSRGSSRRRDRRHGSGGGGGGSSRRDEERKRRRREEEGRKSSSKKTTSSSHRREPY